VNWAGFYTVDPSSSQPTPTLILGPFQGKVACQTIAFGRGVCGAVAATRRTQLVPDVDRFPGHIACDGESRSEIVVPVVVYGGKGEGMEERNGEGGKDGEGDEARREGRLVAIIDVDCADKDGFDEVDREGLERLAALLGRACDWA
jgi:L-methionine (R)-S-oxide reductase